MDDLVSRARSYATEAHSRINHRRKYSLELYDIHLKNVAEIVASVTSDPEMIAAAWLHDVVEDTPASFFDIEKEFGVNIAELVGEVTDVSRPSDGNRATRKTIDRTHLSGVTIRGKTIKLADLIDNCRDILRQDPEFAKTYLTEMALLLEVLSDGDPRLYSQALSMVQENAKELNLHPSIISGLSFTHPAPPTGPYPLHTVSNMFVNTFVARDISRVLPSVDYPLSEVVVSLMKKEHYRVLGVRHNGLIQGYVLREDPLKERSFRHGQIIKDNADFSEVIMTLNHHNFCFVKMLDSVVGVIARDDIQHPYMRMWLFGIITLVEMQIIPLIEQAWPNDSWKSLISSKRLVMAEALQKERLRRNQPTSLLACLSLSDKLRIMVENRSLLEYFGSSKRRAYKVCKEFESLRNNLAHAQDIVTHDFALIVRLALQIESMGRV